MNYYRNKKHTYDMNDYTANANDYSSPINGVVLGPESIQEEPDNNATSNINEVKNK